MHRIVLGSPPAPDPRAEPRSGVHVDGTTLGRARSPRRNVRHDGASGRRLHSGSDAPRAFSDRYRAIRQGRAPRRPASPRVDHQRRGNDGRASRPRRGRHHERPSPPSSRRLRPPPPPARGDTRHSELARCSHSCVRRSGSEQPEAPFDWIRSGSLRVARPQPRRPGRTPSRRGSRPRPSRRPPRRAGRCPCRAPPGVQWRAAA